MKSSFSHTPAPTLITVGKQLTPSSSHLSMTNSSIRFGRSAVAQPPQEQLAQALLAEFAKEPGLSSITHQQLLKTIQQGKPLSLPKGYRYDYGLIQPDGTVESASAQLKALIEPNSKKAINRPSQAKPILMRVKTPQTNQAMQLYIDKILKADFSHEYRNKSTGVTTNSVVLTDLIEKLISGNAEEGLSKPVASKIMHYMNGKESKYAQLNQLYRIQVPGDEQLTHSLNQNALTRQKLIGLELAQKMYAESQEVEWHSIALSLALGVAGEPTINHVFKDGGPVASTVRTGLMSGIDIMGNILSVFGIVNENLKARARSLTFKTVYSAEDRQNFFKNMFNPKGEAGPDIKQGVKAGVLGGLIGVLFNIPAGTILSMPKADVLSRSIIGGIGAAGSAVAIPPVIKGSKESFEHSIIRLIQDKKILLPRGIKEGSVEYHQYIEKMALKEMNARIGIASSIKATHPIPLVGMGALILAGEKLGIPREYVQTAYMAIAPVMHNFLRLLATGIEKYWTIPRRMKKLEQLISESKDQTFNKKQMNRMDSAFLSPPDRWLSQGLTQTGYVVAFGSILLAAEVLCFAQAFQKNKNQTQVAKTQHAKPIERKPISFNLNPSYRPQPLRPMFVPTPMTTIINRPYYYPYPNLYPVPVMPPLYRAPYQTIPPQPTVAPLWNTQMNQFPNRTIPGVSNICSVIRLEIKS